MSLTVSCSVGRIALLHDVRIEKSANVDSKLSVRNEILVDRLKDFNYDLDEYTDFRFKSVIEDYNAHQSRPERRKDDSYTKIVSAENEKLLAKAKDNKEKGLKKAIRKPTALAHEYVLQVGDRDTNGTLNCDVELNKRLMKRVLEKIQEKYPHVEVLLATYHADEPNGTPHMHICVQFVGDGYKQGLKEQISISKALENDGFERGVDRGDYAINRWVEDVKDNIMEPLMKEIMLEEREIVNDSRGHIDTRLFRKKAIEEAAALEDVRQEKSQLIQDNMVLELDKIQLQNDIKDIERDVELAKEEFGDPEELVLRATELDIEIENKEQKIKEQEQKIQQLKEKYDEMESQPPQVKVIEKVVEIPQVVEKNVNYKKIALTLFKAFEKVMLLLTKDHSKVFDDVFDEIAEEEYFEGKNDFLRSIKTVFPKAKISEEPLFDLDGNLFEKKEGKNIDFHDLR